MDGQIIPAELNLQTIVLWVPILAGVAVWGFSAVDKMNRLVAIGGGTRTAESSQLCIALLLAVFTELLTVAALITGVGQFAAIISLSAYVVVACVSRFDPADGEGGLVVVARKRFARDMSIIGVFIFLTAVTLVSRTLIYA